MWRNKRKEKLEGHLLANLYASLSEHGSMAHPIAGRVSRFCQVLCMCRPLSWRSSGYATWAGSVGAEWCSWKRWRERQAAYPVWEVGAFPDLTRRGISRCGIVSGCTSPTASSAAHVGQRPQSPRIPSSPTPLRYVRLETTSNPPSLVSDTAPDRYLDREWTGWLSLDCIGIARVASCCSANGAHVFQLAARPWWPYQKPAKRKGILAVCSTTLSYQSRPISHKYSSS